MIKIDLQRGMDLPARRGVTCPGTNVIDTDSLAAGPKSCRRPPSPSDIRVRFAHPGNSDLAGRLYKWLSVEMRVFRDS